jgi:phosphatidylglycerol:prolipoprotein diacylglycerol transferase
MRQILFEVPGIHLRIFGFGVMLCLAFFGAIGLAAWRARREKLDPEVVYDLAFWVLVGGLVGARAFYVWQYWGTRITGVAEIFEIWKGGIVFYGGLMGSSLASYLYWLRRRFPLRPMLDVIAPSAALGLALGRLGCFLNGCCYGDQCDLPWAVAFPIESPPWYDQLRDGEIVYPSPGAHGPYRRYLMILDDGPEKNHILRDDRAKPDAPPIEPTREVRSFVGPDGKTVQRTVKVMSVGARALPVHPSQLYSSIDGVLLLLLLSAYYPLRRRDGEVFALFLACYPITRMLVEQVRGDEAAFFAGMTVSQNVSVLMLGVAGLFWGYLLRQPAGRHADAPAEEAVAVA